MKPSDQARWQGSVDSWLAQGWASAGLFLNPGNGVILADTGQLAAGWHDFTFIVSSSKISAGYIEIQHRNAANNANIGFHTVVNDGYSNTILNISNYKIVVNERMRFITTAGISSRICASIIYKLRV